ncbi:hypothetical protein EsH8_II_001582 [Colletotrichum jinshuiense]
MSLRLLEHLSGATSLFSALERVFVLRNFGAIGIVTTAVWLLSPLGGQALSLRLLSKRPLYSNSTQNVTYLGPDFLSRVYLDPQSVSRISTVYLSSLSTPETLRESPRDLWGNPKTSISDSRTGEADPSGWKPLTSANNAASYTNLIGIPVKAFGDGVASEFVVSSVNMDIQCSSLELTDTETFKQSLKEPLVVNYSGGGTFPNGTTSIVFPEEFARSRNLTSFIYMTNTSWTQFVSDMTQPMTIFYGSMAQMTWGTAQQGGLPISLATCTMLPRVLETKLTCNGQVCQVVATRRKQQVTQKTGLITNILDIVRRPHFCTMGSSEASYDSSQTERFIFSGSTGTASRILDLWQMPLAEFEERFQHVINTYWYASASEMFWQGNLSSYYHQAHVVQTPAAVTEDLGLHYVCDWTWFGLAVAVLILLEGLAIVNMVLRFRTCVPDIFGYVSSLVIGNMYCEAKGLEQSSALDGLERANALGHMRFQLADVKGTEDVGKIAFVPRLSGERLGQDGQDEIGGSRVRFNRYYN